MASQNWSFSGATTNTTSTNYAQVTFNLDGSDFSSYLNGNPTPISDTGRPLLLKSMAINLSTSSGGDGYLVAQDTSANDASYSKRSLQGIYTLAGSVSATMNYPFYATGSDDVAWIGFKKANNSTLVRYQRGSYSGHTTYLVYNGDSSPTVTHTSSALNSNGTVWTAPSAPQSVSATATGSDSISVSWSAPSDNGGSSVNNYTVFYSGNGGSTWSRVATSSTSTTLTGLSGSTTYSIRVAAHNAVTDEHNSYHGQSATSSGVIVGAAGTASATTDAPYLTPVITNGVSNYTALRVGDSPSEYVAADYTYTYYSQSGTNFSLSGNVPNGVAVTPSSGTTYAYVGGTIGTNATGTYTFTLTASGPGGTDTDSASWTIRQALPVWTDTTLANGTKGTYYSSSFSATNAVSWVITGVPAGLSTSGTSGATVTISGTPTVYGSQTITATPYQSDGDAGTTRNITFTISDSAISWSDQVLATSIVTQDQSYSDAVTATGSDNITYSIASGSLPTGVTLNTSTGAITGTPTVPNTYTFTVQATNGDSSSTITTSSLTITVEAAGGFVKVWNGSAWVEGTAYIYNGSSWIEGTVQIHNGSGWTDSFSS